MTRWNQWVAKMSRLKELRKKSGKESSPSGTFVMEAEWLRSEELRPDRLGPSIDQVENPERVRVERWRPTRTLGPLPPR